MTSEPPLTLAPNRPDVLDETFEGEAVLVNLRLGRYYALDAIATEIWGRICDGVPVSAIAEVVGQPRGIEHDAALALLTPLVLQLVDEELVTVTAGRLPAPLADRPEGPVPAPQLQVFTDMEDLLLLDPIHDVDLDGTGWPQAPHSATG